MLDDPLGLTPLHVAAKLGFREIVRALTKEGGVKPDVVDDAGGA